MKWGRIHMYYKTSYTSPVGLLTLACHGDNIVGLWNQGQKHYGAGILEEMLARDDVPVLEKGKIWLDRYFAGKNPNMSELPLAPIGGEFRQIVWSIICEIPYGKVTTYGEIAKKVAKKMNRASMSSQAVGGAVGRNPISIIIPCHRVVGTNGSLTGYAAGIDIKVKLLELEGLNMSSFF